LKNITLGAFLIITLISLCLGVNCSEQPVTEWSREINILTKKIEQYHPIPWAKISREAFMSKAKEIKANISYWQKERVILELMKLVALLRDGHTQVFLFNQGSFNLWFPIRLEKFHDGIFIVATDVKNIGLIGAKVVKMGKLDVESAFSRVGTIIAADSDHGIARLATNYLSNAVILKTLGVIETKTLLPLEVILLDGEKKKVSVESAKWFTRFYWAWNKTSVPTNNKIKTIFDDKLNTLPLYLSKFIPTSNRAIYWFEYIQEDKLFYFQFNRVIDWNKVPFRDFTKSLFKAADKHINEIDKFVIDLRFNDGGNGYMLAPMISEFENRQNWLTKGKLYIIVGNHTFSAASNFIGQMKKRTNVITIGDIAAGPLNWCSDTIMLNLPASNLMVNISTMFWQMGHLLDRRGYYPPDYYIPSTFRDYISCSDPVLEAIKANSVKSLKDILFTKGVDKFKSWLLKSKDFYGDIKRWFPYISPDIINYVYTILIPAGKLDEALEIARINSVLNPKDFRAWYLLANINETKGKLKEALNCYDKLLTVEPYHFQAKQDRQRVLGLIKPVRRERE